MSRGLEVTGRWVVKRQEDVDLAQLAFPALGTEAVVDALFGEKGIHVGDEGQMGGVETEAGAAGGELVLAVTVGQDAVIANATELRRRDMGQETADEFVGGQRHDLLDRRAGFSVVKILEGDRPLVDAENPVIGDGDAVDVAPQIANQVGGVVEGLLGIDHPVVAAQRLKQRLPAGFGGKRGLSAQAQLAMIVECLQGSEELAPEDLGQRFDAKQEVLGGAHEGAAVVLERSAGDDAVDVRVVVQRLAPGMQDHDDAQFAVPQVLGKGLEGLGGEREQQAVDPLGVVARQGDQVMRQGEDDVEVLDRQQLKLAGVDPGRSLTPAALGAVAVATAVVADLGVSAMVAFIDVATECRGPAFLDVRHGLVLLGGEDVRLPIVVAIGAEDIGDLELDVRRLGWEFPLDFTAQASLGVHAERL